MSVELVGLAYDQKQADAIWCDHTILESYRLILDDDFRKKVDYRSMLYHKGQLELLSELEKLLRQGGQGVSIVGLKAARFFAGVEDSLGDGGELALDYQFIRYFASLAMVDDFLVADPFLRELLRKIGFLNHPKAWSLLEVRDFIGLSDALREVRMQDIIEASQKISLIAGAFSLEGLVRNYIEFLNYARNNGLTPFFYNSQSALKQWGNLVDRHNLRSERIVTEALNPFKQAKIGRRKSQPSTAVKPKKNLAERLKLKREMEALIGGLADSDPLIRQKSAESLGRLDDPETVPHLIHSLNDSEPEVRLEALRAMGKITSSSVSGTIDGYLLTSLADDDASIVRIHAGYLLSRRKVKQAIPVLLDLVEQMQPHFATILAYHPALPKDAGSLRRLAKMAHSSFPEVRRDVAFILGRIPQKTAETLLEKLSSDEDEEVQSNALYSLWDLRAKNLKKMLRSDVGKSEKTQKTTHVIQAWLQK